MPLEARWAVALLVDQPATGAVETIPRHTEIRDVLARKICSRMAMAEVRRRGGKLVFGHAVRFNRIAAASHAAAGFVTVEELVGLNVLNRFVVLLSRRPRAPRPNSAPSI